MVERGPKAGRVTDLETVRGLFTRPSEKEREKLAKRGVHYVGDDAFFEEVQQMVADSGAILEGHFDLGSPEESDSTV